MYAGSSEKWYPRVRDDRKLSYETVERDMERANTTIASLLRQMEDMKTVHGSVTGNQLTFTFTLAYSPITTLLAVDNVGLQLAIKTKYFLSSLTGVCSSKHTLNLMIGLLVMIENITARILHVAVGVMGDS